ncbi:hypothetical protein [Pseudomonas sp. Marseille-Q0931]|uniref:hypothetical protein n=1 Tax=Pseudomonas sp. Marseille-Q0931 TaxID=2697507 RepID=UPI0023BA38CF|nr:hypothetical protein [Pseudomonas sp. Marseille-Q0931]
MQIVVSCDYLVAPAFCEPSHIVDKVSDLVNIKREIDGGGVRATIESNALLKLSEIGYYPCSALFKRNISASFAELFSIKDVTKVVYHLASMTLDDDNFFPECVAYWNRKEIAPDIKGCSHERGEAIIDLVESIFLANHFHGKSLSILHHPLELGHKSVTFTGELTNSIPETPPPLPVTLEDNISLFSDYSEFLSQFDAAAAYNAAKNSEEIKDALILGAVALARGCGKAGIENFEFSNKFIESLSLHQCAPTQRFSNTAFDVICHVIAGVEKYPHKPFYSDLDKKIQKTRDGKLAWRTHVTTGNPALRFMYWVGGDGLTLANIGNKKDLEIL